MELATSLLQNISVVAAFLLAVLALRRSRRRARPGIWGASAFIALAVVLLVAALGDTVDGEWVTKGLVIVLLAFPYLLLRFAVSFRTVSKLWVRLATVVTAGMMTATVVLPPVPEEGALRPTWFLVYTAAVVVYWTALSAVTAILLWRPGADQPTLARRRLRLMSTATVTMNLLILMAAVGAGEGVGEVVVQGLLLATLMSFALGLAPPRLVRLAWRRPEDEALRRATEELVGATTVAEVTDKLLPHVARIVGAPGATVLDRDGREVASYGEVHARDASDVVIPLSPPFGSLVVATSAFTPFFGDEEMRLLRALGAFADISLARCILNEKDQENQASLQRAKEEAERANEAKNDFLSLMSHELRTPLNVVLGFGQILEMSELDEEDREAVDFILKAGRHLLELINEVLDLSKIESGRMTISPEPVDLADIAAEAQELIRPLALDRSIQLTSDLGQCRRHITADRQRLKQVLLNLLSNAVKFNREGGEIALSCRPGTADRLRLEIKDTGAGIPPALIDRLFEPFERLGAEAGPVEGTGLGLALSKQLVELMGGEIGVESREGAGSTFWIELGEAPAPEEESLTGPGDEVDAASVHSGERHVLLIEDNLASLKLIERLLARQSGISVIPAMTGRLGLELAREHRPDMIVLDQHLPDMRGVEVLQQLRADPETRDIPVVVVSADATAGRRARALDLGAKEYMTKPIDVPAFLKVLDNVLTGDDRPD